MPLWTKEAMAARLVRYADLRPFRTAFRDATTTGSTGQEDFTFIGSGLGESAEQYVHLRENHGFDLGGVRLAFGGVVSQYSRDTAEILVVHSGRWRLHFGPNREDGSIELAPGDVVSVPIHLYRGFSKLDEGPGFLWMPLGWDDPDKATWTSALFDTEADHGLRLVRGGRFIDTTSGTYELKDMEPEGALDGAEPTEGKTVPLAKMLECVLRAEEMQPNPASPLAARDIEEAGVIAPRATSDGFPAGPIAGWWPHGLNLRRLTLETGGYVPMHARQEAEVLFVQSGTMEVSWEGGEMMMGAGDTLSVPITLQHAFRNTASVPAILFVVRGTEDPKMPVFASAPATDDEMAMASVCSTRKAFQSPDGEADDPAV